MTTMDSDGKITIVRGDTFYLELANIEIDGAIIDWTNYKARFVVKTAIGGKKIMDLSELDGIDLSTSGKMNIEKNAEFMKLLSARNYVYDLEITDPDGIVDTWFNNKTLEIKDEVAD